MAQLLDTIITGYLNESKGADIAASATVDLSTATGNFITITGTATITALGTVAAGARRTLHFSDVCTITHNATSLILPGGVDIVTAADDIITFMSLGSGNWRCMTYQRAYNSRGLRDTHRGLTIVNNVTNPNYQVDIAASEVILQDTSGNTISISSLSVTADITASGANGLDTGAEASSTWYHIWAIAKADGTKASLLSTSATAPTMPSGYIFKSYLGAVYNNASSNFVAFSQIGKEATIASVVVVSSGTQTSFTAINLATVVPSTAKRVSGWSQQGNISAGGMGGVSIASTSAGLGETFQGNSYYKSTGEFSLPVITAQTVYYKNISTTTQCSIYVSSWSY